MIFAFLTLLTSIVTIFLILHFDHLHTKYSADHDVNSIQKFHVNPVPRVGGIGLFFGIGIVFVSSYFAGYANNQFVILLLFSSLPCFVFGCLEDLTKAVGVNVRLVATICSALLAGNLLNAWLSNLQIFAIDDLMKSIPLFAIIVTGFAVAGVSNSFNIIDGYNGLSAGVGFIVLAAISFVSYELQDQEIMMASLAMCCALFGFLIFNYPNGRIFLGDGGAYFLGFWIAELSVLLTVRHNDVSKWFPLLLCAYPIVETLFTIYRRLIRKKHPGQPDGCHLHQLIYKRAVRCGVGATDSKSILLRNSLTAPYLWVFTLLSVIPAVIFWNDVMILRIYMLSYSIGYICIYRKLSRFKTPKWLVIDRNFLSNR